MHRLPRSIFALLSAPVLTLAALGCAVSSAPDESETSEDAVTTPCAGAACETLAPRGIDPRYGVAATGGRLYWFSTGASDEQWDLASCSLPACSDAAVIAPVAGIPSQLQAAGDAIAFLAWNPDDGSRSTLYHGDASGIVGLPQRFVSHPEHLHLAVDGDAAFVLEKDGMLYECRLSTGSCTGEPLEGRLGGNTPMRLTPTKIYFLAGNLVYAADRDTPRLARWVSTTSELHDLVMAGEDRWDVLLDVSSVDFGTTLQKHGTNVRTTLPGELSATAVTPLALYVATLDSRDSFLGKGGAIHRVTRGIAKTRAVATDQFAEAIAVHGGYVYWVHTERTGPKAGETMFRRARL